MSDRERVIYIEHGNQILEQRYKFEVEWNYELYTGYVALEFTDGVSTNDEVVITDGYLPDEYVDEFNEWILDQVSQYRFKKYCKQTKQKDNNKK
jgi:hypothetical protein